MLQEKQFKRDVAQKISVIKILSGNFEQAEDGATALNANDGLVKRVNLLATIVTKNDAGEGMEGQKDAVVDDGTGQIRLRFFDNETMLKRLGVGDFVAIIGRPRRYGVETYIVSEILKTVNDVKWAEVRRLELQINAQKGAGNEKLVENRVEKNEKDDRNLLLGGWSDTISKAKIELYSLIKELDAGRGADISSVVNKFNNKFNDGNAELLIREMIKSGDLFEVLPGRLKVLE